jgi:Tfp pilus assembly protein PilF
MKCVRLLTLALVAVLMPAALLAQAQGRVKGTVKDAKGNPIPNAKMLITCPEIKVFRQEPKVDEKGRYSILIVDATKRYMFHVEAPGFQGLEQLNKPLTGQQTLELDFTLQTLQEVQAATEPAGLSALREGVALMEQGDKTAARAKFVAATVADANLYLAWLQLANLDLDAGRLDDAMAEAEKCLAASPSYAACLAVAANTCKAKGDNAGFEKYMTAYRGANPGDPVVFYNDAVGFLNKGDDAQAKPLLEKALEVDPAYPDALYQLGMICVRMGDSPKAKELFTKFLEVAPTHAEAPTATEMLKYL